MRFNSFLGLGDLFGAFESGHISRYKVCFKLLTIPSEVKLT